VNEHRVAIGNEALFTRPWAEAVAAERAGTPQPAGLLGMELVRLGLERGSTAHEAVDVMTALLEQHGQWGSAVAGQPHEHGSYDNSYLIADPREAWILETAGSDWAARKVDTGPAAISNEISIRTNPDLTSSGLRERAIQRGWFPGDRDFDMAAAYGDKQMPLQVSHIRRCRAEDLLSRQGAQGGISVPSMFQVLRDHLEGTFLNGPMFDPSRPDFYTLCMHEHPSSPTWGNTAASMVVELHDDPDRPIVVWWAPATPCTSIYLPIFLDADRLPEPISRPESNGGRDPRQQPTSPFDPTSVWWRWQHLLDVVKDPQASRFNERAAVVRQRFRSLEEEWMAAVPSLPPDRSSRAEFSAQCLDAALNASEELIRHFGADLSRPIDPRWVTTEQRA